MSVSFVVPLPLTYEICGVVGHTGTACQVIAMGEPNQEMTNHMSNAQRGHFYPNTYNIGWKDHPNVFLQK